MNLIKTRSVLDRVFLYLYPMWSFWEQDTFIGQPDYVIIGSGIVGLSAAIALKEKRPDQSVLILEAGHLPSGASTKNAGFACFGSPSELLMDLKNSNSNDVFGLVAKRLKGLSLLREMIGDEKMGYETPGSFELFQNRAEFEKTCDALHFLNQEAKLTLGFEPYHENSQIIKNSGLRNFEGAIKINGEGQLDTGKMMKALISKAVSLGVEIINGLPVKEIKEQASNIEIITEQGIFSAAKCLVATNGFAKNLLPELTLNPARAQVLITEPIDGLKIKGTFHFEQGYYYFRNVGQRLLFGGGRNLDPKKEETTQTDINPEIQNHLLSLLRTSIIPNHKFNIENQWTGIMGLGNQKVPIIKAVGQHVVCAVRLGGMGIAIGSLVGKEAAELLLE